MGDKINDVLEIRLSDYPEACNLCRIGLITTYADTHKWFQSVTSYCIGVVKSGRIRRVLENKVYEFQAGDVYVSYPGIVGKSEYFDDAQVYVIHFTEEFINYDSAGSSIKDRYINFLKSDELVGEREYVLSKVALDSEDRAFLVKLVERFYYEFNQRREGMFDILHAMLLTIVDFIGWKFLYQPKVRNAEMRYNRSNKLLADSVDYIHSHFNERLTLEPLLKQFGISKATYCTLFKKVYNVTFHDYLSELRRQRAVDLLIGTDMSIENIAVESGFGEVTALYRVFMRYYGISPGKYRKENREKGD